MDNKEGAKLLRYNTTRGPFSILHALKGIEYGSNKTRIRITADFPKIGKNKIRGTTKRKWPKSATTMHSFLNNKIVINVFQLH